MRPWTALALSMLITLALPPTVQAETAAPDESVQALEALTQQGDRAARTRLARRYETGQGVPLDMGLAAHHYERAAHMGDPDAQFALSAMFREGRGVDPDRLLSLVWLRKAAANGHPKARELVGLPPVGTAASAPR